MAIGGKNMEADNDAKLLRALEIDLKHLNISTSHDINLTGIHAKLLSEKINRVKAQIEIIQKRVKAKAPPAPK
jgi:hypothetical protein